MPLSLLFRRLGLVCSLAFAAGIAGTGELRADDYPIAVKDVRFGFPPGPFAKNKDEYLFKAGKWAPVTVTLECHLAEPFPDQEMEIVVGTPDGDGVVSEVRCNVAVKSERVYRKSAPPSAGDYQIIQLQRQLFIKPGAVSTSVSVQIRNVISGKPLAEPF